MAYIYELFQFVREKHILFVYQGEFTGAITKSILTMAERNLKLLEEEESTKKKLFQLLVECLQNVSMHHEKSDHELANQAIFIIAKDESKYSIASGNFIHSHHVKSLKAQLDEVNKLDKEGLKKMYHDIIQRKELSSKGGAGLGFIDMARRSGSKLDYDFHPVSDQLIFFSLQMHIQTIMS